MTKVKKTDLFNLSEVVTLREAKDRIDEFVPTITTIDDAVDAINLCSIWDYFKKKAKPIAEDKLNSCKECEVRTSSRTNFSVKRVKKPVKKIYNSTPEIEELQSEISKIEEDLKLKKEKLKQLQQMSGYKEQDNGHYWKSC